ncbi:MAG: Transcriptional repressor nrdR [uncultured bacterium]|uniref:Transcriptional repressor NrdR n=4 Tax=Candidatus Daviesiibacteriota TaxID=1752718 RepID=A0A0G0HXV8_9BACT|nr:MAG: Transcriptional repressor nrdR [uncultured bacterium]KKQ08721.1 MAG: Transcriptional repressor NrdR [Candidatus Daviesbacteria bacterium GW2011_GWB1_36_5]KKQ15877.1 MAG: Transcriptional repressor NrdR [Candidatus Daviesbacteria bacterium GW2011_GWA1_36_8]OGE16667.1 MAG: transcriptional regulator NrdR [Candidatus Daviesbacteria bacterium RIFCSPHIGHO2_01_FULL_36_37]OGE31651.1 MAG: transcriptional regulator NrdR [Candidatus Daviesbacteria bacterium RIFCSPHIGHO2_02_FULL_37_9]OGE34744.1 MAG
MKCPFCYSELSNVIDKRAVKSSGEIRRRRECLKCRRRYTTYERVSAVELAVIKKDGRREPFDILKLKGGLIRALEKRPAFLEIDSIVSKIEAKLKAKGNFEIESRIIGQVSLSELKKIDKVAYLRFASVYRKFEEPGDFTKELQKIH